MKSALDSRFTATFVKYCADPLVLSRLKANRHRFLIEANLTTITGLPFIVLALLILQSMHDLMDDYGGSSTKSTYYFHEAVGIASFNPHSKEYQSPEDNRYTSLVKTIQELMLNNKAFADIVNDFLTWDQNNPR